MCWVQQLSRRCWRQGCLDEQLKETALLQHPKAMISLACELHVAREVVDLLVVQQASMIEVRINPKGVHISPAGAPCHWQLSWRGGPAGPVHCGE